MEKRKIWLWAIGGVVAGALVVGLAWGLVSWRGGEEVGEVALEVADAAEEEGFNYGWTKYPYIAHAFGGILGDTYTNSHEAFLLNYQLGQRVFEVDFSITEDGVPVLAHDAESWREQVGVGSEVLFTFANFQTKLNRGKYRPVSIEQLLEIMAEYPDIYIVTDTKYTEKEGSDIVFKAIIEAAEKKDARLLDRFVPQIYGEEMFEWIMTQHRWKSVIYTLYANPKWTVENVKAFCERTGVKVVTMWHYWATEEIVKEWGSIGVQVAVHTVNNVEEGPEGRGEKVLKGLGVKLFYTDFLVP